jgi:hypothetical protein
VKVAIDYGDCARYPRPLQLVQGASCKESVSQQTV